jgi:hypothetical protein
MAPAKRNDKRVGYIRVSSVDQNTVRQLDSEQLDEVFTDKAFWQGHKAPTVTGCPRIPARG